MARKSTPISAHATEAQQRRLDAMLDVLHEIREGLDYSTYTDAEALAELQTSVLAVARDASDVALKSAGAIRQLERAAAIALLKLRAEGGGS